MLKNIYNYCTIIDLMVCEHINFSDIVFLMILRIKLNNEN